MWFREEQKLRCDKKIYLKLSTYFIPLISILVLININLTPYAITLAKVVMILGSGMTAHDFTNNRCSLMSTIIGIILHAIPFYICVYKTTYVVKFYHKLFCFIFLLVCLLNYLYVVKIWPYSFSPFTCIIIGLFIIFS